MRVGIIGLPQVGKTSIFRVLTHSGGSESHPPKSGAQVGIARVVDPRLDQLAKLIPPDKLTYPTVECVDVATMGQETLRDAGFLSQLRQTDALLHVIRMFEEETVPHVKGTLDAARDLSDMELELILTDLVVIENRLERIEKDRKKIRNPELEVEQELLERARKMLEENQPLRAGEWSGEDKKRLRGFTFLSEKPMLVVFNVGEDQVGEEQAILRDPEIEPLWKRRNSFGIVVGGKLEAELAEMSEEESTEFLALFGLEEPGRDRIVRAAHELLGLIVFFTVGETECRSWSIPRGATAVRAAGAIHSDLEHHFIRAEVIHWDQLLEAGGFVEAKQQGTLRLEGKEYVVKDGDIVHIRHSG